MTTLAPRPETDDANEAAVKAARDAYRPAYEQGLDSDVASLADYFGWHAAIKAARAQIVREEMADLRAQLTRQRAMLMDRKIAAYEAGDTPREAHLDGQITGLALALRLLPTDTEEAAR